MTAVTATRCATQLMSSAVFSNSVEPLLGADSFSLSGLFMFCFLAAQGGVRRRERRTILPVLTVFLFPCFYASETPDQITFVPGAIRFAFTALAALQIQRF